ncbi:MAG: YigZ family protein [Eubacteriales bacterium]|nr:YigZ family protein [Eubacteriales bacterium]
MNIIFKEANFELIIKKSKFISYSYPIFSEEEAIQKINIIKKKHYDAKHNTFAYIMGEDGSIIKYNDDKEPQGTAGKPILDIMHNNFLTYSLIIVTRYFGGILLGTSGLIHAYKDSAKGVIKESIILPIKKSIRIKILIQYDYINIIKRFIDEVSKRDIYLLNELYEEEVEMLFSVDINEIEYFNQQIINLTKGKIKFNQLDIINYVYYDKKVHILK